MVKKPTPQPEVTDTETEQPKAPSPPISFAEPASQVAEGVVFADEPIAAPAPKIELSDREMRALQDAASAENDKRDFIAKIHEANAPVPEPSQLAGPVPLRVQEQTKLEMEAGRAQVQKNEAAMAGRPPMPKDPYNDSRNVEVFRPAQFDEYRSNFKNPAQTPSKETTGAQQLVRG